MLAFGPVEAEERRNEHEGERGEDFNITSFEVIFCQGERTTTQSIIRNTYSYRRDK
jgi:hypothetical protein